MDKNTQTLSTGSKRKSLRLLKFFICFKFTKISKFFAIKNFLCQKFAIPFGLFFPLSTKTNPRIDNTADSNKRHLIINLFAY